MLLNRSPANGLLRDVNAPGVPSPSGKSVTIPSQTPVVGHPIGWFAGRVYTPSGAIFDN